MKDSLEALSDTYSHVFQHFTTKVLFTISLLIFCEPVRTIRRVPHKNANEILRIHQVRIFEKQKTLTRTIQQVLRITTGRLQLLEILGALSKRGPSPGARSTNASITYVCTSWLISPIFLNIANLFA